MILSIIEFIFISGSLCYAFLITKIYLGWYKTRECRIIENQSVGISIVIAARNESARIQQCIQSILDNQFNENLFEIIIVDDHSNDDTAAKVRQFTNKNILYVAQSQGFQGKKAALTLGVNKSKYPLILCTDADSTVDKNWIRSHVTAYEESNVQFSTGIVLPEINSTIFSKFQWLDFASTMAITAHGIYSHSYYLANGANLSYRKSAFDLVQGFENNTDLASGDDIFLAQKIGEKFPKSIRFVKSKNAYINTKSEPDWRSFIAQRKRWATKSMCSGYSKVIKIQSFVFIYSLMLVMGSLLTITLFHSLWPVVVSSMAIKMTTDYIFLHRLAVYFDRKEVMKAFVPCFFIYFGHIILSGYFALFPSQYLWKDRSTK